MEYNSKIKCPKCGSTNVKIVESKGIFTRCCAECECVFNDKPVSYSKMVLTNLSNERINLFNKYFSM